VEVVVEQDPDMNPPAEPLFDLDEQLVPGFAVQVVDDDRPLLDATADDVVPGGARELRTGDPWHPSRLTPRDDARNRPPGTCPRDCPWDTSVSGVGDRFRADCG
jgi:hypothetical protein